MIRWVLGVIRVADLVPGRHADGHEDFAIAAKRDARAGRALCPCLRHEDVFDVTQRGAPVETRPRQRNRRRIAFPLEVGMRAPRHRLRVGEVDELILCILGVQHDVHESRVDGAGVHVREPADRLGV